MVPRRAGKGVDRPHFRRDGATQRTRFYAAYRPGSPDMSEPGQVRDHGLSFNAALPLTGALLDAQPPQRIGIVGALTGQCV
jgi:hypothetical protein